MILTRRHISEEDKALAGAILDRDTCRHGPNADCSEHHYNNLVSDIANALAIARREAREEAFRDMAVALVGLPMQGTMNYRRGYEEGVRDAIRTTEAAKKGDTDAERG